MKLFRVCLISVMALILLLGFTSICSAASVIDVTKNSFGDYIVKVDGTEMTESNTIYTRPHLSNGRLMVELRYIAEKLGCEVSWNPADNKITVTGKNTVVLAIDSSKALVNGKEVTLDAPAQLVDRWTMIPLRFLSEALGVEVRYTPPSAPVPAQYDSSIDYTGMCPEFRQIAALISESTVGIDSHGNYRIHCVERTNIAVGIADFKDYFLISQVGYTDMTYEYVRTALNVLASPESSEKVLSIIQQPGWYESAEIDADKHIEIYKNGQFTNIRVYPN